MFNKKFIIPSLHILFHLNMLLIAAIALQTWVYPLNLMPFCIGIVLFVSWLVYDITPTISRRFLHTVFCATSAVLLGVFCTHKQQKNHDFYAWHNKNVSIRGTVTEKKLVDNPFTKECVTITVAQTKKVENESDWCATPCAINVYTSRTSAFDIDDIIEIPSVTLKKPQKATFNFYLLKEGIVATAHEKKLDYTIVHHPEHSWRRWLFNQKNQMVNRLKKTMSPDAYTLITTLFLGNRIVCKKEVDQASEWYQKWGISHYLARSGLHLVLIILLWEGALRFVPLPFILKQLILLLFALIYCLFSWTSISFLRAFTVFLLYKICTLFNRQTHLLHLLSICCFGLLLYNPAQLFFLDFQLSFGLTFAIAWFNLMMRTINARTAANH